MAYTDEILHRLPINQQYTFTVLGMFQHNCIFWSSIPLAYANTYKEITIDTINLCDCEIRMNNFETYRAKNDGAIVKIYNNGFNIYSYDQDVNGFWLDALSKNYNTTIGVFDILFTLH